MCTTFVAKIVVSIVNTLIFLLGLTMFIIGLLVRSDPAFSKQALGDVVKKVEESGKQAGLDIDTSGFSVYEIAYSFTIAIIVFGLFLAIISLVGLIGVKYSLKPVLIVYFVVTLILFLVQVTLILIAVIDKDVFDDNVKPRLKDTIKEFYRGFESSDGTTVVWNGIMMELECCGVDGYEDFKDAGNWEKLHSTLVTPFACCKEYDQGPTCGEDPLNENLNNFKIGCYDKIWNFLISNSGIVIGVAAAVLCSQFVLLLLTYMIITSLGKIDTIV